MTTINYILLGVFSWMISIYTLNITTLYGQTISLGTCQGKKILLVNIATNSPYAAAQLPELEQFYQTHKDSIVVIGFPSNSFGNEPLDNDELKTVLKNTYQLSFPVVEKTDVTGMDAQPVYKWLQSDADNGVAGAILKDDFQKFLINKDGTLSGIFSSKTSVLDSKVQTAIQY